MSALMGTVCKSRCFMLPSRVVSLGLTWSMLKCKVPSVHSFILNMQQTVLHFLHLPQILTSSPEHIYVVLHDCESAARGQLAAGSSCVMRICLPCFLQQIG